MSEGYRWPEGYRCACALCFDVDAESPILYTDRSYERRLSTMSHQTYGPRVGVPRILRLLARYDVRATFFVPGFTAERHPEAVEAIVAAGHEVGHHGYLHEPLYDLDPAREEEILLRGKEILRRFTGVDPVGYRAPFWEMNPEMPALLRRHGFLYDSSLMGDDTPYALETPNGPLAEVPIHWMLDDWEQYAYFGVPTIGQNIENPAKVLNLWTSEFDAMYEEGLLFALTMHPFLTGRPSRTRVLEQVIRFVRQYQGVWWATCGEIARYQLGLP